MMSVLSKASLQYLSNQILDDNTILLIKFTDCFSTRIALIKDSLGWTEFLSNNSRITRKIIIKILAIAAMEDQELSSECNLVVLNRLKESNYFRLLENNINWRNVEPLSWKSQADKLFEKSISLEFFENIKKHFNKEKFRLSMIDEAAFITYAHGHDIKVVSPDGTYIKYFKNIYTGYWEQLNMFQQNENKRLG